ncbi:uncharacterized protein LOC126382390 isoform X2 [Pectinophora gossypiella]|nr:uncharacterized protein LOC126382390 isoform X2 [Pectinophora gossypiella]
MKTAVTVLQEMMVKLGQTPEYECISQTGPQHLAMFEYRCMARGVVVTAEARSKKDAKQEAARRMLQALAARGEPVPPPYGLLHPPSSSYPTMPGVGSATATPAMGSHSFVALLKDLCEEYRLPGVEYELVSDMGPPHYRLFTIRARVGAHERFATSTTKKAARQQAAEQLYTYMRENLARLTKDFVEEEALVRAHERAMERYVEVREEVSWRPHLGQRVADYHLGLRTHIDPDKCELAQAALAELDNSEDKAKPEDVLQAAVAALGLTLTCTSPESESGALCLLELAPTSPALTFAGCTPRVATLSALQYLRLALAYEDTSKV